ncbi:MAG: zinc ribbon domain-containing protein [Candidatus Omnitrophica bacterium]|nr:zinc ribbon domain-containing protein [Candidatus Omnitrophota bacterium]
MKRLFILALVLAFGFTCLTACTSTQKGAGYGSAAGAGLGAIIGHQSGKTGEGALIGAAAGGLTGALLGDHMDEQEAQKYRAPDMFCPQCGATFPPDAKYCPADGTELKPKAN